MREERVLLRPVRSSRPGTMPAGMVLVIGLLALVAAAVMNAESIHRRSIGKVDNPQWRVSVSSAVASFADFLWLNAPRNTLDRALGREHSGADPSGPAITLPEFAADEQAEGTDIREPTADEPLRTHIVGDSLAGDAGRALQRVAADTGLMTAELTYEVSSGLSRPDFVNWPARLADDLLPAHDPEVLIVLFGANDMQNMVDEDGSAVDVGSVRWLEMYRERVGETMDLLRDPDGGRLTVWLGLPSVGPGSGLDPVVVDQVNHIYWSEAEERPWVDFVDTWAMFVDDDGEYAERLPMGDGQARELRDLDGIHFTMAGAERLAWAVLEHVAEYVDMGDTVSPPASQSLPDDVTEREELPERRPPA